MTDTPRRIVVALSTIPSRCDQLQETLVSLGSQTVKVDNIYITVSKESAKERRPYPTQKLSRLLKKTLPGIGKLIILDEDFGPLTKLMGPLLAEKDPETLIITVDDDQKYSERLVETLLQGSKDHPGSVVCLCGHVVGKFPNLWGFRCSRKDNAWPMKHVYLQPGSMVDIVSGWCGVLYPRKAFGDLVPHPAMESLRTDTLKILNKHDDLYISGWLDLLGVKKYVVSYADSADRVEDAQLAHATKNSLSMGDAGPTPAQGIKHMNEFWGVIRALRSRGMLVSDISVKWHKSLFTLAFAALFVGAVAGAFLYCRKKPSVTIEYV